MTTVSEAETITLDDRPIEKDGVFYRRYRNTPFGVVITAPAYVGPLAQSAAGMCAAADQAGVRTFWCGDRLYVRIGARWLRSCPLPGDHLPRRVGAPGGAYVA